MKKHALLCTSILVFAHAMAAFAGVTISSPSNGSTVGSNVKFLATANTSCSKGVGSMGIYPAAYQLAYISNGSSLNATLPLNQGTYHVVIVAWDNCGGAGTAGVTIDVKSGSGVYVTTPANNSTVGSPTSFVASATTTCPEGVAAMGVYTAPYQLAYAENGASLNTTLSLSPGTYHAVVQEWDHCGGAATTPVTIVVSGSGKTFYNLQSSGGWHGYAQQPPTYGDCDACTPAGPGTTWAMYQGVKSPTLSGSSTQFNLGGKTGYSDVLWNNHLIGDFSSQGLPDSDHTLVPKLHTFTYDVYFYGNNLGAAQAIEFDINQFFNNLGFTWGHECRIAGGNEWDVWDNANFRWAPTGIACNPVENGWNHLTVVGARTANNQVLYQSITFNGVTHVLNWTLPPFSAPGWHGITINYQMDGNYKQSPYTVWVDKLNFTYE